MTVSQLLAGKDREVVCTSPDSPLAAVADLLARRRIGAVMVLDAAGAIAGIISERDVVRALAEGGAAALDEPTSRHMTSRVTTCEETSRVLDVMELMTRGRFRHVPVVRDGRLAGIVSIGDVVKHRLAEIEDDARAMRDYIAAS